MAQRSLPSRLWYEFVRYALRFGMGLAYRLRYTGRENVPSEGGVLAVCNHQSHFDPPLVGAGCPRRMNYIARDTLFWLGPFRWFITSLDAIPIDRDGIRLAGIKETLRRLKRGEMVLIFPEGTRSRDGDVGTFRPGFSTLAVRGRAAILPVAIEGAFQAWPRWQKLPRLGTIHIHYGTPMFPEEIQQYEEGELIKELEKRIRRYQAQLREHPAFARRRHTRRR